MKNYNLWQKIPHQIRETCEAQNAFSFRRKRIFDTHSVVMRVLDLVSGSEKSYLNVLHESTPDLYSPAASSFCAARKKVPSALFSAIRDDLVELHRDCFDEVQTWRGFHLYAVDGSLLNLPRELVREGFYLPNKAYYPQGLLSNLYRLSDKMICGVDFSDSLNERAASKRLISSLNSNDLVIYDRGYFSYDLFCEHREVKVEALFRIQSGSTFYEIKNFLKSKSLDQIIEITPGEGGRRNARKAGREGVLEPIKIRLIKHQVGDEVHLLGTTILDKSIPASEFVKLYYERWKIEELYKALKNTTQIEIFHARNLNGVEQEIHASSIVWNLSRMIEGLVPSDFKKNL